MKKDDLTFEFNGIILNKKESIFEDKIEPITETTTVNFEEWISFNDKMMNKKVYDENTHYYNNSKRIIIDYIQKNFNILGFMISSVACYNGQVLEAKTIKFTNIEDLYDLFNNKQIFIHNITYVPNYPTIINNKIEMPIDKHYLKLRYATLEN